MPVSVLQCQELTVSLAWQAVKTGPNGNPATRDNFDMSSSSYRCLDATCQVYCGKTCLKAKKIWGSWELENFRGFQKCLEQPWFTRKCEVFWLPPIFLRHLDLSHKTTCFVQGWRCRGALYIKYRRVIHIYRQFCIYSQWKSIPMLPRCCPSHPVKSTHGRITWNSHLPWRR